MSEVSAGTTTPADATERILALLREADFVPPMFEIANPERRHTVELDYGSYLEMLTWFKRSAPAEARTLFFG
jgi:hypothetical protein